jgi:hypothetical protein
MPTKHIENTTASPIFVGGKLIPPGTGRDIDVAFLPPEHRDGAPATSADEPPSLHALVEALHAKSVKDITAELPSLTQEALDMLREAEQGSAKPRSSLLSAIEAERIRRAAEQMNAKDDEAYANQLAGLTPEQLAAIGEKPLA